MEIILDEIFDNVDGTVTFKATLLVTVPKHLAYDLPIPHEELDRDDNYAYKMKPANIGLEPQEIAENYFYENHA